MADENIERLKKVETKGKPVKCIQWLQDRH